MIVSVGDLLLDVLVKWRAGIDIEDVVERLALQPGGSAANVAAWLAALSVPCGFVGAAGTDIAGDLLVEDLHRRGVRCAVARYPQAQTGILLLETMQDGTNRPSARRGANNLMVPDEEQQRLLAGATWLHLSTYALYPEPARAPLLQAIAAAHERAVPVSIDLGAPHVMHHIGREAYLQLLRQAAPDLLFANEVEVQALAGSEFEPPAAQLLQRTPWAELNESEPQAIDRYVTRQGAAWVAAQAMIAALAPVAVIKRGVAGCDVQAGASHFSLQASLAVEEVDATGAGDAFVAGFIAARRAGRSLRQAAEAGVSQGAQCVAILGGRPPLNVAAHG